MAGYRSPYVAAQAYATLDRFSGGRVIAGLGVGYLEAEFDVLGAVFEGRGARLDGAIAAMRAAWSGESVDHDGIFPAHGHTMFPTPEQPNIPVWIGGNGDRAIRRAAAFGDGWMPISVEEAESAVTGMPPLATFERPRRGSPPRSGSGPSSAARLSPSASHRSNAPSGTGMSRPGRWPPTWGATKRRAWSG